MSALTQDRKADKLGTDDVVYPGKLRYPVEASTSIFGGAMVGVNAAGNAVPASAIGALKIVGRAERQCVNQATGGTVSPDGIANGTAGSIACPIEQGVFYFNINADSTITKANFGANVYASDDNTVSLSDAGGTRPYAGFIVDPAGAMAPTPLSTQVGVFLGVANPYAANPEAPASLATQFKARNVVTSLQANTGSTTGVLTETANGAWAAQDGVTNVVGDIVFIQAGTANLVAAADSGPWQITSLGGASAKWVLTRPDWFSHGNVVAPGQVIDVGGEGTLCAGTAWKSFAAVGSAVIDTNDPTFFAGRVVQSVSLTAGTVTISNVGIRSATKSSLTAQLNTKAGTTTATVGYGTIAAMTPGYAGTASAVVDAYVANMTIQNADTSSLNITITNW